MKQADVPTPSTLAARPKDADLRRYLGEHPRIPGNRLTLLVDGQETYPAMLEAIAGAQKTIVLESYIFDADETGRRFVEALTERAQQGVEVRVLIDGFGAMGTPRSFFAPLLEAGGRLAVYRPLTHWPWRWTKGYLKRDHRKILVVDDRVGFIGGINIGNEYAPVEWGGDNWHDAHARVEGPAARALTIIFNRTWRRLTKEDWSPKLGSPVIAGDTDVQVLESLMTRRHHVRKAYLHAMHQARVSIRITNAYCIPDKAVRRAIRAALRRGVKVQLLLAGRTDVVMVKLASRALYSKLLRWGVEIYEWTDRVLHAKTAVIDGLWCSIGSYNLDRRSLLHNLEANVACVDARLGAALERQFEADIAQSQRIDPRTWHRRSPLQKLLEALCFQLRYFL